MEHLLGFTALTIVAVIVSVCAFRWRSIGFALLTAFFIRAVAALFHFYIAPLPDSQADAATFERVAWEWAQEPLGLQFLDNPSYFISWLISLLYRVTDRSSLMAQSLSVLFGTLTVLVGWLLAKELWGERTARKAMWVISVFPTLILYSALTMREAYIWFFLLVGLLGVVRWLNDPSVKNGAITLIGFVGAAAFHGALAVGLFAFLSLVVTDQIKRLLSGLSRGHLYLLSLVTILFSLTPLTLYFMDVFSLPYLGYASQAVDITRITKEMDVATRGGAAYPEWTKADNFAEMFWKTPIRVAYFLLSPFSWDVRAPQHMIAWFDGLLYLWLVFLAWRNWHMIWHDKRTQWVFLIVGAIVLVFAFGVGNFGTAVRHRAKIVAALIVLCAPRLPRVTFSGQRSHNYSKSRVVRGTV